MHLLFTSHASCSGKLLALSAVRFQLVQRSILKMSVSIKFDGCLTADEDCELRTKRQNLQAPLDMTVTKQLPFSWKPPQYILCNKHVLTLPLEGALPSSRMFCAALYSVTSVLYCCGLQPLTVARGVRVNRRRGAAGEGSRGGDCLDVGKFVQHKLLATFSSAGRFIVLWVFIDVCSAQSNLSWLLQIHSAPSNTRLTLHSP